MRLIALLLLLATAATAQSPIYDAEFEFRITPPTGMQLYTPEELSLAMQRPVEQFANLPRDASPDGVAIHEYHWRDLTGHRRQVGVSLADNVEGEAPIIDTLDGWAASAEAQFGVTIAPNDRELIRRGQLVLGWRVTADRVSADGASKRVTYCYLPVLVGHKTLRDRIAIIQAESLKVDWDMYLPEFNAMIDSMSYPLPRVGGAAAVSGGAAQGSQAAGGGGAVGAGGARRAQGEGWGSLQVTGSLLLALVLLGSLFVGGAGKTSAGA